MKKFIPEILITLLLAFLIGSLFLHSEGLNRVINYFGGIALFFVFFAAGDQFAKWLGRGYYFAMVSAICFFAFTFHFFV